MNPISTPMIIQINPPIFFNIMIIGHLLANIVLIFAVFWVRNKVFNPKEDDEIEDIIGAENMEYARKLAGKLGQSEAKVRPNPTPAFAKWEGDMAEEKGGYVDPVLQGAPGKEYEAYVPANDAKRKMEGREDNNFV